MAAKEVQKEAKKEVVKKGRRLKRSVRKTLGAVFLASAIAVAAIPTEGLQAAPTNRTKPVKVTSYHKNEKDKNGVYLSDVPVVTKDDPIYTTGDGRYQFAFTYPDADKTGNQVAVILRFNYTGNLDGGVLEVPNEVDAYKQYDTGSTAQGFAAVNRSGDFLYYQVMVPTVDEHGSPVYVYDPDTEDHVKRDENGDPIQQTHPEYRPCYYDARGEWESLKDGEFYYRTSASPDAEGNYTYALTGDNALVQRIHNATVAYIGDQYLEADDATDRSWTVKDFVTADNPEKGAFANHSNISTLKLGKDLSGIGNYAFYGCASIQKVEVGNGMTSIGNYAFADCIQMKEFNIDFASNLQLIGDHAFFNCYNLQSFTMPTSVQKLGDSAFENCRSITQILLNGKDNDGSVRLNEIGYDAFKGCRSLESLTFPENVSEVLDVTTFQGCTSLKFIATESATFDIIPGVENEDKGKGDDPDYTLKQFKQEVPSTFYFRGPQGRALHQTATENEFAFSYYDGTLGRDVYELTVTETDSEGRTYRAVYRVDSNNELVHHEMDSTMTTVQIPAAIGPYGVNTIDAGTFQNNCNITKVVIPGTITRIEQYAFRGCHNLEDVIWDNPNPNLVIEAGAFKTQDVSMNTHGGKVHKLTDKPSLNFTGPISDTTSPFLYAMSPSENINYGTQPANTYITYYSGWPSNLEVRYDHVTDKNTLVDYPTFQELKQGLKYIVKKEAGSNGYAYMTADYEKAAKRAIEKYTNPDFDPGPNESKELTQDELDIINAALNIVLPTGIEAIGKTTDEDGNVLGLFEYKENTEITDSSGNLGNDHVLRKSITAYGLTEVGERAFAGCKYVTSIKFEGNTQSIGTHAFEDCEELTTVNLPATVSKLGTRPFAGCTKLSVVNFGGGPYFTCDNSIIYELEGGTKAKLVEYLCGRSIGTVRKEEVAGVRELYPEAFMGTNVGIADLSSSQIKDVPVSAFQDTLSLYQVILPEDYCQSISKDAFSDSSLKLIHIPASVTFIDNDSFRDVHDKTGADGTDGLTDLKQLEFECAADTAASVFADKNDIKWSPYVPIKYFTVEFLDWDQTSLKVESVQAGGDATPPTPEEMPERKGYTHVGWSLPYTRVTKDIDTVAVYEPESETYCYITYYYDNYTVYTTQEVRFGKDAIPISSPDSKVNPGAEFLGWVLFGGNDSGKAPEWTNIRSNMSVIAVYKGGSGSGNLGPSGSPNPDDPNASGSPNPNDPNASGSPDPNNPNGSGSPDPNNPNGSGSPNPNDPNGTGGSGSNTLYTLTVQNGSGSGSYVEGAQPIIIANNPASGQEFDHWSVSPEDVKIASTVLSASVITMPAKDVTVTAHYKVSSGGSGNTGSGNNSQRPNGSVNSVTKNGTTVVIDKNGLSNTGVVSATVNGSSDNFTIKITDTTEATEAALRALMNEYGNLDNIKYFPMDISLYDSTGTTKITDTTGLSVSITLPLPDSLITYAGNNKVASTLNDRLEKLSARFTTIQGVSCITFTAEHFSPYVIYVDTGDLSSGLVSDSTPKTGDFIHPKWFLSIGLACLSFIFFMQKDAKRQKKVKVKVKA